MDEHPSEIGYCITLAGCGRTEGWSECYGWDGGAPAAFGCSRHAGGHGVVARSAEEAEDALGHQGDLPSLPCRECDWEEWRDREVPDDKPDFAPTRLVTGTGPGW